MGGPLLLGLCLSFLFLAVTFFGIYGVTFDAARIEVVEGEASNGCDAALAGSLA